MVYFLNANQEAVLHLILLEITNYLVNLYFNEDTVHLHKTCRNIKGKGCDIQHS